MPRSRSLAACAACALLAAPLVAACTPSPEPSSAIPPLAGTEPNGEQHRDGLQLLADARSSVRAAATVHLDGEVVADHVAVSVDLLAVRDGSLSGTLTGAGGSLEVQLSKTTAYVRPTGALGPLVRALGLPAVLARTAPDSAFWSLPAADATALSAYSLPALATTLVPPATSASGLTSGDVDGDPVVTAVAGGRAVSVAVTGSAQLVRVTDGAGSEVTLDEVSSTPAADLVTPDATPTP